MTEDVGWLAEPNRDSLAKALTAAFGDPDPSRRAQLARRRYETCFSTNSRIERLNQLYYGIM